MIEAEILDTNAEAGSRIASEAELIERYGIGRSVLREAVRILEYDGIATMRRGPGGGLFVSRPNGEGLVHAAALWLHLNDAQITDLFDVREILESRSAASAADKIDADGTELLRGMLVRERELAEEQAYDEYTAQTLRFHESVARLSGNVVSLLMVMTLVELTQAYSSAGSYRDADMVAETNAHEAIVRAIVAGDAPLASQRMISHLRASRTFAEQSSTRSTRSGARRASVRRR
jgi:DNA-binding FadR family transcriptional regulator